MLALPVALALILPTLGAAESATEARQKVSISELKGVEVRGDFQVGPTRFVLEVDPGEERTVMVDLSSREGEDRSYSVGVEDFSVSDDGLDNIQFYGNGSGPFSAKSWIVPVVENISLKHGELASIPVKVSIPKNASVGDHYAVVLFQREPTDPSKPGFNIVARVGALFLITVKGDVIRDGSLQQFLASKHVYWSLPAQFTMQYRNAGTVHIVPTGKIDVRNLLGITVDTIPVQDWYVLRNSVRRREIVWQPRFALGYYSATLHLDAVGTIPASEKTVWFWVIPALPVLLCLLAIFVVSFIVQAFFSHFEIRRKKGEEAKGGNQ